MEYFFLITWYDGNDNHIGIIDFPEQEGPHGFYEHHLLQRIMTQHLDLGKYSPTFFEAVEDIGFIVGPFRKEEVDLFSLQVINGSQNFDLNKLVDLRINK